MLRRTTPILEGWSFTSPNGNTSTVNLPHTWNALDGYQGGNRYLRGKGTYCKAFSRPAFKVGEERVYLELPAAASTAEVWLNGKYVCRHEGGYSTFRADVTDFLKEKNDLEITVDNGPSNTVYPQVADFTFYGGLYRGADLLIVSNDHFDLDYHGGRGVKVTACAEGEKGTVRVESFVTGRGKVEVTLLDADGKTAAEGAGSDVSLDLPEAHLWDGLEDPYLYTAVARLLNDGGEAVDEVRIRFGIRSIRFDPKEGFFLNGRSYPLRGVSRHQDRKGLGSALTEKEHREDMELIREIGANSVRLAHYQHDQFFYDLCDEYGIVVWAEIPYISQHMAQGQENTLSQMRELIVQNYHHPSIVVWGLSNEITIKEPDREGMMENQRRLNELCHQLDSTRPTTLACYAMCPPFHPVAHISDLVGYNLYLGWYVPGLGLNDLFMNFFHWKWPNRCLSYSEYGAEGMPNLHSSHPHRGDHTEEYQAKYHEYMLDCFARHPFLWSTYCWNLFDFAADARDQGGEPGMNHKGLVTFDRKIKKDSFYIYKAHWSREPFVHLCGSRYVDRPEAVTSVKVYSNQPKVALYANGKLVEERTGEHVFVFKIPLDGEVRLEARAGEQRDTAIVRRVEKSNPAYKLHKKKSKSKNWV